MCICECGHVCVCECSDVHINVHTYVCVWNAVMCVHVDCRDACICECSVVCICV